MIHHKVQGYAERYESVAPVFERLESGKSFSLSLLVVIDILLFSSLRLYSRFLGIFYCAQGKMSTPLTCVFLIYCTSFSTCREYTVSVLSLVLSNRSHMCVFVR